MGAEALAVGDEAPRCPGSGSILIAQLRHKTGEIVTPPEAKSGDYDLVMIASPTWWFQTSMPIRSSLESPDAKTVLNGKPFACASISRRYFSVNLGQQRKLAEKNGGRFVDNTHFVVAGNQVTSMLAWLGYMKHGEPQKRVMGQTMPPPNLSPTTRSRRGASPTASPTRCSGPPPLPGFGGPSSWASALSLGRSGSAATIATSLPPWPEGPGASACPT